MKCFDAKVLLTNYLIRKWLVRWAGSITRLSLTYVLVLIRAYVKCAVNGSHFFECLFFVMMSDAIRRRRQAGGKVGYFHKWNQIDKQAPLTYCTILK